MEFGMTSDRNCLRDKQQVKEEENNTRHSRPRVKTATLNRSFASPRMDLIVWLIPFLALRNVVKVDAHSWVTAENGLSTLEGPRGPVLVIEPPHRSTYTNDTGIEIKCQAEGQPRARIFWTTKDGSLANDVDGLRYVRHDGTLVLRPFAAKDYKPAVHATTYRCGASNSFGTILSREVNIRAVLRQNYQATVYDAFAFRGNTAVLRCNFPSGLASDVTVEAWIRDDGYSFDRKGIVEESYTFLRSGELLIHDSGPQINARKYGCRTRSVMRGEPVSSTITGRVIITEPPGPSPPRLLLHKSRVTARFGNTVELPCVAEGNPVPSYRWMKGDTHRHHSVKENYRVWLRSGVMTFRNVRHEDGGIYICVAENAEGQLRSETALLVTEPLEPILAPQKQVIDIGKELLLNCTIRGQPVSSISWTKDGQPLSSGSRVTYLSQTIAQIRTVQREDQGMYQCLVHNEDDSAQATAQVLINDVPPTFIAVFPSLTSHPKNPVTLSCTVSGSPIPKINWFLDDQKVHSTDRVRADSYLSNRGYVVGYLNFTSARVEDGGLYECKAENEVGRVSHSARLNVLGPIFVRPLRNITAVSGQTVHIRCPFGGFPVEKITWLKGGETVLMTSRITMTEEGVLMILNVDRVSDGGEYKCGVEDSMGHVATGTTILNVLVAPVIDAHYFPEMVPAEENSRTRLICSVSKGDQPINMNWFKNGVPLITRQDLNIQKTDDSAIVSFRKVTAEDSGLYTCTATNMAATVNRTLHLTVNVPPRWTITPTNASTTVGETLRLQCSANGYPVPSITWKKAKGTSSTNFSFVYSSSRIQQYSNGTLLIRESEVSDGGQYLCSANNGIGTGIRAAIRVKVYVPPRITTKFRSVSKKKGDEVALICEVSGDTPMSVTWRRNTELIDPALNKRWGATEGRDLPCVIYPATSLCRSEATRYTFLEKSEDQKLTAEFYIRPLVKEDTGLYNCQVNNSYGRDEAHYQITVQDIPDAPYNVTVVNVTSSAITIQWEIPFDGNSPVKRYIIYYKRESDSWKSHAQQDAVAGTKTLATVKGLKPMTSYHVEVSAENSLGEGERSETVVITTEESVPSGPPEEISVQATGPQSFKVSWKPPRRSLQHGKILGYYIGYKSKKGKDFQYKHVERHEELETGLQSTYVTNLKPATTYAVVVQSYNSAGPGPISDEIYGTTLESAPPTSPRLSASLQDSSKIKVHWERDPKDKSLVTEFELHFKPENGEWQPKRLPPDATSYDLLDLKCGTLYSFYIKATNSLGTGEPSETFKLRTAGAAPVSPSADEFITSNKTTIGLRFWAWKSGGCPVTSFTVKYKLKYYQQWQSVAENVVSEEGTYYIRQLLPDREYLLHVTAHSEAGNTEKEYEVRTLGTTLIVTPSPDLSTRSAAPVFHKNLAVFIPVLLSILVVIVVLVLAVLCLWRNWQDRHTPTSLETPRHKSARNDEGGILMADMAAKKAAAAGTNNVDLLDMRPKEGYYSSPSKHPTPVASNLRRRDHEYAEPYTALPPPRRLSTESTCRGFMPTNCTYVTLKPCCEIANSFPECDCQHAMEDNTRSTLGRRPSRPDSRASLLFQVVYSFNDWRAPVLTEEPPYTVEFYNTQGTVVRCAADGRPAPKISWVKRDGTAVAEKVGLRHVRADGSLVFPPFRSDEYRPDIHATVYRCTASNVVGVLASREVHVRAVVSQQFDVRVYDEFVILGNTAVLKCHIPTFVEDFVDVTAWYRDDGRVFHADGTEGGKFSVLPGGELHIRNVQQQDGFRGYRCQVKLRLTGETKQSLTAGRLIVKEPHSTVQPQITHRESEVRVQEGDQVFMPCAAQAYPPPSYNWYKIRDGRRVPILRGQRVLQYSGTLTLRHAKLDDGGQFICVVNNSVGQQIVTTELVISVALRANVSPSEHRAQLGQSVTFNCSVSGRPEPSVTWVKNLLPVESDGERVRIAALSRLLSISNVRREDKGIYQCLISNGFDSAQGAASLVLGDASPVLDSVFEEQTLHPGGPVSLKCSATGSPLPQVTWRLDGLPLPDLLRYRVGDYVTRDSRVVSYVNVTSLRSEDGGYYECAASNEVGRVSHEGRITVTGPPAVRYMPNVTLLAGGKLRVRCPAGGSVSSITWERDGRPLPQNHRQEVFPNGTLVLRQVNRKSDEGRYTCVVKSPEGTLAKGDVFIQVLVGPRIDSFSFPADLEEGMRSVAVCAAIAGDSPLTLTWLKDDKLLDPELNAIVDSVNNFTSTLTFNKVGPKHGGSYTCVATNPAASVNHTAKMVVNVSPYWTVQPSDAMAVVGSHVTLDCQSEGHPTPQIRWKSNSALESASANYQTVISNPHVQILENGSLIIREVTSLDAGDYMCQATNGVSPGLSAVVKLSVHVPAHFATKFQSMTAKKGETLRLNCEAFGEQPLVLRWTKDKQSLENNLPDSRYGEDQKVNENGTTSVMTITSAERTDSALFSCQTSNKYGEDEQNIQVIILERPDTPKDLQVKGLTSRSATVSWVQPFSGNTPLTGYVLQYQKTPENSKEDSKLSSESWKEDVKSLTVPPTDVSVEVKGLLPIMAYTFRVFAENILGRSKTSEIVTSTTLEEAPSAPPSDISIEALSSQILKVTWKAPVEDYPKGQVTGYYLGYKEVDSKEQLQYKTLKATGQPIQEYRLKSLRKFTKYAVRVQAFNSAGSGPASDDKMAQTLQYDPPASPIVRLSTTGAISALVEWGPGDETPVTAYVMSLREDQGEWIEQRFSSDMMSHEVKPLKCGTRYQLKLSAINSVGSGEPSDLVQFKTEGTAPVAPSKPLFLNINSTFVLLNLDSWQTGGCPVNSFIVQYKSTGEGDWLLVSSNIQASTEPLIISELSPGTWYNVLMTARNDAGATDAEYVFATLTESGDPVSPVSHGSTHNQSTFYRLLSIVVPLVCAGVIVLVVTVVVGIVVTRRHAPQRYGPRQDGDDGGDNRSNANHKMDNMGMTPMGSKKGRSPYEAPKESLYFPAPYATSRLAAYAAEDGSECDSLPSSTRTTGDRNMSGHTYDVPFPVRRPEAEEQYTRIKRVPVPSVPVNNIYQTPQLPESERWSRRLSYHHQGLERSNLETGFSFKVDSPATRRWSGGYRIPFRKDQPFKLKRVDRDSYRYSDEGSDLEDEDERPEEISEAECDRSLTVMIPPENKNFYILTGTVQ